MLRFDSPTARALAAAAVIACAIAAPVSAALVNLTPTGGAVNSNNGVLLNDLLTGAQMGIVVGDKIFTGFSYSALGDMPPATDVQVLGFRDPAGHWGISFHGSFKDLPGGADSDALIRFMVEVDAASLANGWRITDAHLYLGGVGVGEESYFAVDESFTLSGINETLNVFQSTLGPGTTVQLSDSAFFDPGLNKLFVTKDINAFAAANSGLPARATVIDQSFSQEQIPEPATMALAGLSALAMVYASRRRG
jgi:hypothetical protein